MAIVTGITAEHMLELAGENIEAGFVDLNGHLLLTKRNGEQVDAGMVKGSDATVPDATTSVKGKLQLAQAGDVYTGASGLLGVTPESMKHLSFGLFISAGVDLDTLVETANLHQGTNVNATLALHYPFEGVGGSLIVEKSTNFVVQRYTTRPSSGVSRVVQRAKFNTAAWGDWVELGSWYKGSRYPAFHVKHNTTFARSGTQANLLMNWNTILNNQGSYWNAGTSRFTAPVKGLYEFKLGICNTADTGGPEAGIFKNGSLIDWLAIAYRYYTTATGTIQLELDVNDYVQTYVRNNNSVAISVDGARSHFAGKLLEVL